MYRVLLFLVSIYGSIRGNAVSQFPNKGNVPHQYHSRFLMYEEPYNIEFKYHNYEQMSRFLRATSLRFQNLTALYSIGKSVKGRDLWVMVVSSSPYEHMIGKPDVKYIANIHGNEAVGRELMLHLIHFFVTSYGSDPYVTWLLDNTRIHILPSMNPDGFEVSKEGKYNARGFDLNRNFPDYFKQNNKRSQPETEAVKEWVSKIQFVLSGSLHGGALVASYPFDNTPNAPMAVTAHSFGSVMILCKLSCRQEYVDQRHCVQVFCLFLSKNLKKYSKFQVSFGPISLENLYRLIIESSSICHIERIVFQSFRPTPSISPDDDVFQHLSLTYSRNHGSMYQGLSCSPSQPAFKRGITNGAEWYPLTGGMQDFNYVWNGCMEITLELSCCKYPLASNLSYYWEQNRAPLIKFLAEAHRGVHGFVIDENGNPIERASVKVKSRDVSFSTTKYGEFWRILLPGIYKLEVFSNGYIPREVEFMVIEQHPTLLNVTLYSVKRQYEDESGSVLYNGNTGGRPYPPHRDHTLHYRPQSGANTAADANSGIFSSISNGFNTFVTNLFG
ncbi:Carboxypeptidase M [Ooceraea biroi]|uniref:Carboxypeptidase M n=1 Tax=Ooceraea biroi TaxID=2015173 RepID=A0A026WWF4_OOCBI|nr:Carboxypeptidase M [Ooceraea biroi]